MRIVVLLLVIANLTFFAYTRLDNASRGESARLKQQIQPDKIKLLTPPQVAALGPAKMAALADVCIEWGPFSEVERAKAIAAAGRCVAPERRHAARRKPDNSRGARPAARRRRALQGIAGAIFRQRS
jgi:hypothetical protein